MTKDTLQRLERIDRLIQNKATGNPTKPAIRSSISPRSSSNYLNLIQGPEVTVKFEHGRQSYYCCQECHFEISPSLNSYCKQQTLPF